MGRIKYFMQAWLIAGGRQGYSSPPSSDPHLICLCMNGEWTGRNAKKRNLAFRRPPQGVEGRKETNARVFGIVIVVVVFLLIFLLMCYCLLSLLIPTAPASHSLFLSLYLSCLLVYYTVIHFM
jgi:hypothetical protein